MMPTPECFFFFPLLLLLEKPAGCCGSVRKSFLQFPSLLSGTSRPRAGAHTPYDMKLTGTYHVVEWIVQEQQQCPRQNFVRRRLEMLPIKGRVLRRLARAPGRARGACFCAFAQALRLARAPGRARGACFCGLSWVLRSLRVAGDARFASFCAESRALGVVRAAAPPTAPRARCRSTPR